MIRQISLNCIINISIFLIFFIIRFLFIMIIFLPVQKLSFIFFSWEFLSVKLNLSFRSLSFSLILLLVTLSVLLFSSYYLYGEINFNYYYIVLLVFVSRMFFLIFRNRIFTILLIWDLLGISRFFLVLFYNNWDRCRGAINTALTNRLGDFFLFVFFSSSIFSSYYFLRLSIFISLSFFFVVVASFTKRAQFPFRSWLPKAMRAPTPVSSLVHRRTLVTAGLVLLINFSSSLLNSNLRRIILFAGIFTILFSRISALVEEDLKKVVALSTLSQIGFSILTLGLGLSFISLLHLLRHALFKRCLFIQVGYIIHRSFGQQDGRGYRNIGNFPKFIQIQLLITLFCLCGLFFSRGAVSKDFILELCFSNFFIMIFSLIFFISVFLTFFYSYRLWKRFFSIFSRRVINFSDRKLINFLSLVLVFSSISFIWWINLNLLSLPRLFLYTDFFMPLLFLLFFFCAVYFVLKFITKEFFYKFLVDFLALCVGHNSVNMKFSDLFLNRLNSKGVSLFSFRNFLGGSFLTRKFNSVVLIIFFLFLLF